MAAPPPPGAPPDSIEALKRVRTTENEWDEKLKAAKRWAEEDLQRLRDASEAAVKAAQTEADALRTSTVQTARAAADIEASHIVAEATEAAKAATKGEGKHPADRKDEILAAVLAGFDED
jgi:vacuolar-type H+-ATPase subunit H